MRPGIEEADESAEGFDRWIALRKSTDEARANLIADIVGHPKGAPSVAELDYMNPSLGEDAVRNHLQELREAGVVEELVVEPGKRVRGYPYKFYRITDEARSLFDDNGLFPEDAWRRQYERVEKTTDVREIEKMPRPTESTEG
jgi:DNA-binding transcriptional ArsR family regulator